jgi:hypothetical protein
VFGAGVRATLRQAVLPGIGLSVAFWPLLLLYVSLLGLRLSGPVVWAVLGLSLGVIVWLSRTGGFGERPSLDEMLAGVTLGGMTLLALVFRLGDIQGLPVPLFGDSLHHTMITSIIETTGRVPAGYRPFVPVDTFTYHFGFHTLSAVLGMLTGAAAPKAVLVMGQVLNVASLPVAYLLARELFSSRLAGLAAALITGFVSVMPAYYVNWGRYTQLAGLVLLPVAMAMLLRATRREGKGFEVALAAFCVAGLVVVHYRILIFYGLFVVALAGWYLLANWGDRPLLVSAVGRAGIAVGAGLVVTAPWIWNLYTNYFWGLVGRLGTVSPDYISAYNSGDNFRLYEGKVLPALGALGLVAALADILVGVGPAINVASPDEGKAGNMSKASLRRLPGDSADGFPGESAQAGFVRVARGLGRRAGAWGALVVATWTALMLVSIWIVPGAIGSYTVAITLFMPLSMLGGYGIGLLAEVPAPRLRVPVMRLSPVALVVAPVAALLMGSWHVADPGFYSYVHDADLRAFHWIKANTPAGSKFLISSEISYAGRAVTASDAGMWLPVLAGRNVSVPALATWTERPSETDFFTDSRTLAAYTQPAADPETQRLVSIGKTPAPVPPGDPRLLALMQKLGITHVYSGTPSTTPGGASKPRLDVAAMSKDTCHYKSLYPPGSDVYVFQVVYSCR